MLTRNGNIFGRVLINSQKQLLLLLLLLLLITLVFINM